MEKETIDRIKEIYYRKTHKLYDIYEMFKSYYGEDNVELSERENMFESIVQNISGLESQGVEINDGVIIARTTNTILSTQTPKITVHWPKITLRNSVGDTINVYDLFAILKVGFNGYLGDITFKRSTYTPVQFQSGYRHSHIYRIGTPNLDIITESQFKNICTAFTNESSFCFGTAPINKTINTIRSTYDVDEEIDKTYMLLCRELDICVRIESLEGIPYIRMKEVKCGDRKYCNSSIARINDEERDFARYFIRHANLNYAYVSDSYVIASTFEDFSRYVTKMLVEYMKANPGRLDGETLKRMTSNVVSKEGSIYEVSKCSEKVYLISEWLKKNKVNVIRFKGTDYDVNITEDDSENEIVNLMASSRVSSYLWNIVTLMINSNCNKTHKNGSKEGGVEVICGADSKGEHEKVRCWFNV